jgi:hypothetical protein
MKPIKEMTIEELKLLKIDWYRAAVENGSIAMCNLVARTFGRDPISIENPGFSSTYGPKYLWRNGDIEIYVDDYGKYMTVKIDGKLVCSTHVTERLFIPGEWVERVRPFAESAAVKKSEWQLSEAEKKRRELIEELTL